MSRKKRMQNVREAKDKKMKKVAIGLTVFLVAVLAFEVPKILHSGSGSAAAAPAAATTSTGPAATTAPAATPPDTTAPTTTPPGTAAAALTPTASSTELPNSDEAPKVGKNQLFAFSRFVSKDPFAQQLGGGTTQNPAGASTGASSSQGSSTSSTSSTTGTTAAAHKQSVRTIAVTGAARIMVNGRVQVVRVGASFPSANPLFRLVSITNGVAKVGIASGSYSSGAKTVSLRAGRPLTLVDTADGIRYQIRLVA